MRQIVVCRTCHEAAPTQDHREVRTPTLLPGWWWLHWRDETDASNTSQTEGRMKTRLTPMEMEERVFVLYDLIQQDGQEVEMCCVVQIDLYCLGSP